MEGQLDKGAVASMPGVLKRTHDQVDQDQNTASLQQDGERPTKRQATGLSNGDFAPNGYGLVNGEGHYSDAPLPPEMLPATIEEFAKSGGPPEIEHITQGFLSLSTVAQRAAQEAHNATEELIAALADPYPSEQNGPWPKVPPDDGPDALKKYRLWDFVHVWRSKFIKLLVLSQWTRNAEAVSKIIDINQFIFTRKTDYREAINWMAELKRSLLNHKIPTPDLKTAIELLSSGKAAWVSDVSCPLTLSR